MIRTLVESAFQTGCLSVASEGLLYQVLASKCYRQDDLAAIAALYDAVHAGQIKREAPTELRLEFPIGRKSC
ncbi:hypothetical protein [Fortiea contorta]|uniref:hypothetical protein n=1 Tax=Fortiea contorta TaxID=1892405 RepID=UPI000368EDE7|nr:hypothetical protein [Fortiea contorta]